MLVIILIQRIALEIKDTEDIVWYVSYLDPKEDIDNKGRLRKQLTITKRINFEKLLIQQGTFCASYIEHVLGTNILFVSIHERR